MKEKIGKLLELLNEYEYFKELKEVPEEEKDLFVQKNFWCELYGVLNSYGCEDYEILNRKFCYMYAISKEYGFIKRLVENNKINKRKIDTRLVRYVENHYDEEGYWVESSYEDYSDSNTLIMLLSISDTPIEDLIDYLR